MVTEASPDKELDPENPFAEVCTQTEMLGGLPIVANGNAVYNSPYQNLQQMVLGQKTPEQALCRDAGNRYLELPHLFTQWGAHATPAIYVDTPAGTQRRFGWDVAATDPSYRQLLEQLIPYLISLLDEEWGIDRVIFHISEEPDEEHLESYSAAKAVVADLLAEVTVVDAISPYEFFQRGLVSLPVVGGHRSCPPFPRHQRGRRVLRG